MEIYQIILMVVGAITIIWLIVKAVKGIFWILGVGLESCFREKYPYDFERNLRWAVDELKSRGYRQTASMDAGSENPGLMMKNPGTGVEMEVRLRAPLFSNKGNSIVVANHGNNSAIIMQDTDSDGNKKLLKKYLE